GDPAGPRGPRGSRGGGRDGGDERVPRRRPPRSLVRDGGGQGEGRRGGGHRRLHRAPGPRRDRLHLRAPAPVRHAPALVVARRVRGRERVGDTAGPVGGRGGAPAHGGPSGAYTFGQWRFANGGVLEILEPLGADGFLHRFLAQRGPGIHHVTFRVPRLRPACDRAEAAGYTIVGHDDS